MVKTAAVQLREGETSSTVLNASGYIAARRRATISSKVTGKVIEINIEEGMSVHQGDVVARLDDDAARASLNLSKAELGAAQRAVDEMTALHDQARLDLSRAERLVGAGVAQQSDLDRARTEAQTYLARLELKRQEVRVAERVVALRRVDLDQLIVRAPFDGVVISKDAQPGEMVSPNSAGGGFTRTGICTVVDMTSLEIEVDVNESYISRVHPGQTVDAILDAYPDWHIPAHVITTIPAADRQRATVLVRIGFEKLDPRLLPDMGVKVAFLEDDRAEQRESNLRLLIPRSALRRDGETDVVFVVRDGRLERRAVRIGAGDGQTVAVVVGLQPGERVVVEGPAELSDGLQITER